jgi:hypothetical protein
MFAAGVPPPRMPAAGDPPAFMSVVLLEASGPVIPAIGMPSAAGCPFAACPFGSVAGAAPGIRPSSGCLSARPLAFLGIFPPFVGAPEQTGVRRTEEITPSAPSTEDGPAVFPHRTVGPQVTALHFTIRSSPDPHKSSRSGQ